MPVLFYPRGLANADSLIEPANSGDQLTARLGALADIFDLFLRPVSGSSPTGVPSKRSASKW
jgi:hypothetical protein